MQSLGLVCTVDLFPVYRQEDGGGSLSSSRKDPGASRRHSSGSSNQPYSSSVPQYPPQPHQQQSFTFVHDSTQTPSSSVVVTSSIVPQPPLRQISATTSATVPPPQLQQPQAPISSSYLQSPISSFAPSTPSDVVWKVDNHIVTESSKMTHALVGATFVQPANVEYQGRKSLMFVFAVSTRHRFSSTRLSPPIHDRTLRSRSKAHSSYDTASLTYSPKPTTFAISLSKPNVMAAHSASTPPKSSPAFKLPPSLPRYRSRLFILPIDFPDSTFLQQLARWGVRLNIRETERKRRKKGDRRSLSPHSPSATRSSGPTPKDRQLSDGQEDPSDDE